MASDNVRSVVVYKYHIVANWCMNVVERTTTVEVKFVLYPVH